MERHVVLYDADCGFCRVSLALLLTWDRRRRLRPVALQDPEAKLLLPGMTADERMSSWHLIHPDGRVTSAGAALEPLLGDLPAGAPLARLVGRFPAAAERGYRWVAEHRSRLGRAIPHWVKARSDELIDSRA